MNRPKIGSIFFENDFHYDVKSFNHLIKNGRNFILSFKRQRSIAYDIEKRSISLITVKRKHKQEWKKQV